MAVLSSKLVDRVTILEVAKETRSATGQATPQYAYRESRWARVEDLSAGMTYKAAMAGSRARTMVTLREPLDLVPIANAIRFESRGRVRTLGVVEVRRRPEADYLEAFCAEIG